MLFLLLHEFHSVYLFPRYISLVHNNAIWINVSITHLCDWSVDDAFVTVLLPQTPAHLQTPTHRQTQYYNSVQDSGLQTTTSCLLAKKKNAFGVSPYWYDHSKTTKLQSFHCFLLNIHWPCRLHHTGPPLHPSASHARPSPAPRPSPGSGHRGPSSDSSSTVSTEPVLSHPDQSDLNKANKSTLTWISLFAD